MSLKIEVNLNPSNSRKINHRSMILILILFTSMILVGMRINYANASNGNWYNPAWQYRKMIIIDHNEVEADFTNFPVLIHLLSDSDLASRAQVDGDDILFTSSTGTKLDHEIELFNSGTGELIAWVRIPSLSGSLDTIIYMYYGNPASGNQQNVNGVWNSNYVMVHHLQETSGIHFDSTSNNWDSTSVSVTQQGANIGKIDGADEFDGSSDTITIGDLDQTGDFTVELWMYAENLIGWRSSVIKMNDYGFEFDSSEDLWARINEGSWTATTGTSDSGLSTGTWYYIVMVWDETNNDLFLYRDGTLINSNTAMSDHVSNNEDLRFGSWNGISEYHDGILDEIRISNVARSENWIETSHNNQNSTSTFFSLGQEEQARRIISPSSTVVGGFLIPVDQLAIIVSYLALALLVGTLSTIFTIRRRRKI